MFLKKTHKYAWACTSDQQEGQVFKGKEKPWF